MDLFRGGIDLVYARWWDWSGGYFGVHASSSLPLFQLHLPWQYASYAIKRLHLA